MTAIMLPPALLFVWDQFGPYHMDRLEAVGTALAGRARVIGIELSATSTTYGWAKTSDGQRFEKRTLFGTTPAETLRGRAVARALIREVSRSGVGAVFVSGYERPSHLCAALIARAQGVRAIVMLDSKYDDKPRRIWLETAKTALMAPYHGGFAAGRRSADYLARLGLRHRLVTQGYDTVSLDRIRRAAGDGDPPSWMQRPFLAIARYVPKKNLDLLLHAYAAYRATTGTDARRLILCGGGPLEANLRASADALGIADDIDFTGFVDQNRIAEFLRDALCLLLPSVEEQWGLVVNEALAFGLPVVLSTNVGATDLLAADGDNGFVLDPHDQPGWTRAMCRLGVDRMLWESMATRSHALAPLGDVTAFVEGVMPHVHDLLPRS